MLLEICLTILAIAATALAFALIRAVSQVRQSIRLIQEDIHALSQEMIQLFNTANEFVQSDLHAFSEETCQLVRKLNDLSSDIDDKSRSLNFLFKPLRFLSSKFDRDLSGSKSHCETIPQILKWIASSALLFKITKEFVRSYAKRPS